MRACQSARYAPRPYIAAAASFDFDALLRGSGTLVLTVHASEVRLVGEQLVSAGLKPDTPVTVSCDGTGTGQQTVSGQLDELELAAVGMTGIVVVTVGKAAALRDRLTWWESRPLYGWRVLVPRTKEQAGAMSDRLRLYGAVPVEVPTIAVEPPRTPTQMERAIKGLVTGRYEWIVFTSTNAVRAVREKFEEFGLDARAFAGVKIACVGEATADAVRAFGITPELVPTDDQSSEGLLADFPPYDDVLDPIDRVLLPRADIATETLAAGLRERGWEIDDVTAYRTVRAAPPPAEIRDAIKSGGFQAVCFTSSSTVRNLVGIAGKPHARTVVASIGPQTAATAREFGLRVDVQPEPGDGARAGRRTGPVRLGQGRRAAGEGGGSGREEGRSPVSPHRPLRPTGDLARSCNFRLRETAEGCTIRRGAHATRSCQRFSAGSRSTQSYQPCGVTTRWARSASADCSKAAAI